jgi:hypothetical protein
MDIFIAKIAQLGVNNILYLPLKQIIQMADRKNNFKQPGKFLYGSHVYGNNFGMYYSASKNIVYETPNINELYLNTINNPILQPVDMVDACAMIHDIELTSNHSLSSIINTNFKVIDNIIKATDPNPLIEYPGKIVAYPLSIIVSILYWGFKKLTTNEEVQFDSIIFCDKRKAYEVNNIKYCDNNLTTHYQNLIDKGIQLSDSNKFKYY